MDVEVIVETPQGSRNKYKVDPKSGRIRLDRMLFTSTVYPLDYGKVPDTLAEDGDPLDMLIWLDEPRNLTMCCAMSGIDTAISDPTFNVPVKSLKSTFNKMSAASSM